jgi:predicted NodU family carbamoyl transferase
MHVCEAPSGAEMEMRKKTKRKKQRQRNNAKMRKGSAKGRREKHCIAMGHDVAHAKTAFALRPSRNLRTLCVNLFIICLYPLPLAGISAFVCGV